MVFAIFLYFFFFDENCTFHRDSIGFHRIALFASVFLNRCDTFSPFNCPLTASKPKKFKIFTATICFLFRMWKCEHRSPCYLLSLLWRQCFWLAANFGAFAPCVHASFAKSREILNSEDSRLFEEICIFCGSYYYLITDVATIVNLGWILTRYFKYVTEFEGNVLVAFVNIFANRKL